MDGDLVRYLQKLTQKKQDEWRDRYSWPFDQGHGQALGSFKKGGKVPKTGLYKLHKGEVVVPTKEVKAAMKKNSNHLMHEEKRETPAMEAKSHSKAFLKKALSEKSMKNVRAKAKKYDGAAGAAY